LVGRAHALSKPDLSAKRYVYFWVDGIHVQARLETATKLIQRIAKRAVDSVFLTNQKVAREITDDVDRCWPASFVTRKVRKGEP
jgi:hypothetical protein